MDQDDQGQERHRQASRVLCPHLVELTHFFAVSIVSATGEKNPKNILDPAFLSTIRLFLTRSYREGFETWEAPLFGSEKARFP